MAGVKHILGLIPANLSKMCQGAPAIKFRVDLSNHSIPRFLWFLQFLECGTEANVYWFDHSTRRVPALEPLPDTGNAKKRGDGLGSVRLRASLPTGA